MCECALVRDARPMNTRRTIVCHAGAMDIACDADRETAAFASGMFCIYAVGSEIVKLYYLRVHLRVIRRATWLDHGHKLITICE